ncbi:MAG: tripartite tricarboxylate transporter TctB family protein [Planctomycetaceae bacterium]|nr:tripartite tricarboxylate transporter TctB family protein [Planctomycetales bacterium]MCB9925257.1 tripartite tricarboxylate transporter TctB family protein [Planctomycetaceae bacterium]
MNVNVSGAGVFSGRSDFEAFSKSVRKETTTTTLANICSCVIVSLLLSGTVFGEYPDRPIQLVVPFGAGGGTDTYARALKQAIEDHQLLPQPLVIVNVPGAGATIGSRRVKNAEPDGYTLLLLHEAIVSAKYSGQAEYGSEAFEPIAGTGRIGLVIAVAEKSRYHTLPELLEDAKARPDRLVFAANIGAPVHFVGAMLEQHWPGARFRFTQSGGGEKRLHDLLGRHAAVSAFSLEEYLRYESAGLRAIAYCDDHRSPDAPDIPTTFEQGVPVQHINMQFWWAPKGTPQDRIDVFATALRKAMQNEDVIERMRKIHCEPTFIRGEEMRKEIAARQATVSAVELRATQELPNVPLYVGLATTALAVVVGVQTLREASRSARHIEWSSYCVRAAMAFVVVTILYVGLLSLNFVGFTIGTFGFVALAGLVFTRFQIRALLPLVIVATAMSFGLSYVFTELFSLVLP